jgi:prepilin-type N-terminal cleavage/methylation domain-containing protein
MKKDGFTLIEVIIAIAVLFLAIAAVFYFYSNLMGNQAKLKEKYTILRISREFVDSVVFSGDLAVRARNKGRREAEGFILKWDIYPAEEKREVLFTSGIAPLAQLNRVHLEVIKKATGKRVLELHFLLNNISSPGI